MNETQAPHAMRQVQRVAIVARSPASTLRRQGYQPELITLLRHWRGGESGWQASGSGPSGSRLGGRPSGSHAGCTWSGCATAPPLSAGATPPGLGANVTSANSILNVARSVTPCAWAPSLMESATIANAAVLLRASHLSSSRDA